MDSNIYLSSNNPNSNFDGDWDDICQYCNKPHSKHLSEIPTPNYKHRLPCEAQKKFMLSEQRRQLHTIKTFVFCGWILIPLVIAVLGFAHPIIGATLFVVALLKLAVVYIKHFGSPDKWIPGHTEKMEKERKMKLYFYHCERNPDGFSKLMYANQCDIDGENLENGN